MVVAALVLASCFNLGEITCSRLQSQKNSFFLLELYVYRMQNAFENKENIRWRGKQARLVLAPNVQADFLRSNPRLTTSGIPCF